jgi:CDGSH-type Zn-finger protein
MNKPKVSQIKAKPGEKIVICRCWKSKKFPLCDGSHRQFNLEQGPAIIEYEKD